MKKLTVFIFALLMISLLPKAQTQDKIDNPNIRTISVTGVAQKEIIPDIIYFTISLKEYKLNTGSKILMTELENQLINSIQEAGIAKENLTVENVYGYNFNWDKKNENKEFLSRKQFQLKLSDAKKLNTILANIDSKAVEYVRVSQYTHSQLESINQDLQVEAVKNAKEKAAALLKPLGEKVGHVIALNEEQQSAQQVYQKSYSSNRMMSGATNESASMESDLDFKNIKLKAEVYIVFLIQ